MNPCDRVDSDFSSISQRRTNREALRKKSVRKVSIFLYSERCGEQRIGFIDFTMSFFFSAIAFSSRRSGPIFTYDTSKDTKVIGRDRTLFF